MCTTAQTAGAGQVHFRLSMPPRPGRWLETDPKAFAWEHAKQTQSHKPRTSKHQPPVSPRATLEFKAMLTITVKATSFRSLTFVNSASQPYSQPRLDPAVQPEAWSHSQQTEQCTCSHWPHLFTALTRTETWELHTHVKLLQGYLCSWRDTAHSV